MFSDKELALMNKDHNMLKPSEKEIGKQSRQLKAQYKTPTDPNKPPSGLTKKEKRIWLEKKKEAEEKAALRKAEQERKAALNSPEELAKRKQARIDADIAKLNKPVKVKDPNDPRKERPRSKKVPMSYYDNLAKYIDR
jgi:hypothetical protein